MDIGEKLKEMQIRWIRLKELSPEMGINIKRDVKEVSEVSFDLLGTKIKRVWRIESGHCIVETTDGTIYEYSKFQTSIALGLDIKEIYQIGWLS